MSTDQSRSDIDDRTTSALSTSSHTYVDDNDALAQSPRSKMTAWSAKHTDPAAEAKLNPPPQAPVLSAAAQALPVPNTAQVGRPTSSRQQQRGDRPPPPECMQSCIESIESCTQNVVRFNERMELNRAQAEAQRQENGDPVVARKAIIPIVFVILSWVFTAYVWRLCSRLIQQNPQGAVLGSRSEGIGLLVGFVVLWLMTMWSYVVVISRGPGLVKDYIGESDPPPAAAQAEHWNGPQPQLQQCHQGATQPMPIPGHARQSSDVPSMHPPQFVDGDAVAIASSSSLPYPSFNADLERFGGYRASSDSMRVLPGSVEPKHVGSPADRSHSRDVSRHTIVEEDAAADTSASAADVEAQLGAELPPPTDDVEALDAAADPQLAGVVGPLAAAAVAGGQGVQEGVELLQRSDPVAPPAAPATSDWAAPQRRPQNDPPPLSASALYCHRCRRVKPPRAHHCRRCGTCVLKMDHHCPWVGGCVGAHNQRFFFIFVFWVTLLELYTLITTAIFFHRGIRSLSLPTSAWRVDGVLISLLPICVVFLIFTGALLGTHVFLMGHNLTTIEHVAVNRMQGRERVLVDRWFGMQKQGGWGALKSKRRMVRDWDDEWGKLIKEGHRWWLGGSNEVHLDKDGAEQQQQRTQADAHLINGTQEKPPAAAAQKQVKQPRRSKHGAFRTNMEQALGPSMLMWFVPLGKHPNEGLEFPMNPRFGQEGVWRKRQDWPPELR